MGGDDPDIRREVERGYGVAIQAKSIGPDIWGR